KGKKKAADASEPQGEKRAAPYRKTCPWDFLDRVERVMTQRRAILLIQCCQFLTKTVLRMFLVDRRRNEGELREEFSILGSTGNVYTVMIDKMSRCNCTTCKHVLFVFLKVLQVRRESALWYQKALLSTELEQIFRDAPLAPNSMAHPHICEAYGRATGKIPVDIDLGKKCILGPDDDCPICYDIMHEAVEDSLYTNSLTFCQECGSALHNECFQ
ncbi:hypothetical protein CPB84DRAFT_1684017, partial [Gymnopilus junonius]